MRGAAHGGPGGAGPSGTELGPSGAWRRKSGAGALQAALRKAERGGEELEGTGLSDMGGDEWGYARGPWRLWAELDWAGAEWGRVLLGRTRQSGAARGVARAAQGRRGAVQAALRKEERGGQSWKAPCSAPTRRLPWGARRSRAEWDWAGAEWGRGPRGCARGSGAVQGREGKRKAERGGAGCLKGGTGAERGCAGGAEREGSGRSKVERGGSELEGAWPSGMGRRSAMRGAPHGGDRVGQGLTGLGWGREGQRATRQQGRARQSGAPQGCSRRRGEAQGGKGQRGERLRRPYQGLRGG